MMTENSQFSKQVCWSSNSTSATAGTWEQCSLMSFLVDWVGWAPCLAQLSFCWFNHHHVDAWWLRTKRAVLLMISFTHEMLCICTPWPSMMHSTIDLSDICSLIHCFIDTSWVHWFSNWFKTQSAIVLSSSILKLIQDSTQEVDQFIHPCTVSFVLCSMTFTECAIYHPQLGFGSWPNSFVTSIAGGTINRLCAEWQQQWQQKSMFFIHIVHAGTTPPTIFHEMPSFDKGRNQMIFSILSNMIITIFLVKVN